MLEAEAHHRKFVDKLGHSQPAQHVFSEIHDAMISLMGELMGKLKIAKHTQLTHLTRPNTN